MISFLVVCNVGFYRWTGRDECWQCLGYTIKSTIGDAIDCNADTACDGITNVPNKAKSACGNNVFTKVDHSTNVARIVLVDQLLN